ncbi:MAG: hypothetical protein KDA85_12950, partial [Planctomycetaceae bacterium]|nr:hypothetical protein [Planctomycetaceae bacterium]
MSVHDEAEEGAATVAFCQPESDSASVMARHLHRTGLVDANTLDDAASGQDCIQLSAYVPTASAASGEDDSRDRLHAVGDDAAGDEQFLVIDNDELVADSVAAVDPASSDAGCRFVHGASDCDVPASVPFAAATPHASTSSRISVLLTARRRVTSVSVFIVL